MEYNEAVSYLDSFTDYERGHRRGDAVNYDLRRMEELLHRLGDPHLGPRTVHIAGSKGKGSTAAMIAAALMSAGYRTGLYTSPHLFSLRERLQFNGRMPTEEEFAHLVDRLQGPVEVVNAEANYGELTTFELLTALGFCYFSAWQVDFQVIEVGLGGRLDATNVVHPDLAVLTNISLEHTDVLGGTLAQIASEKAGIIKPGAVVVSAPQAREVEEVISDRCRAMGVRLIWVGDDVKYKVGAYDVNGQELEISGRLATYSIRLPLLGSFQGENAAVAVAALEALSEKGCVISPGSIIQGLEQVSWPGRLEVVSRAPLTIVDGAHSPYSAQRLRESLEAYFPDKTPRILVLGVSQDKDIGGITSALTPFFSAVVATKSRHPRGAGISELVCYLDTPFLEVFSAPTVTEAMVIARELAGEHGLVCATGSLFVVAEAMGSVSEAKG